MLKWLFTDPTTKEVFLALKEMFSSTHKLNFENYRIFI